MTTRDAPASGDLHKGIRAWLTNAVDLDRSALSVTIAYLVVFLAVFGVLVVPLGLLGALAALAAIIFTGLIPGAALVRRIIPGPTLMHYVVLGTVLGLALWSLGGMASHLTGIFAVRWLPALLAFAIWFLPHRAVSRARDRDGLPVLAVLGSIVGTVGLLPALRTILSSQPSSGWSGWHQFYIDLPFQVAMTSEVSMRAPQEYPWVPDTVLSYPWLFHSSMGVLGSTAQVSSVNMVLQLWPVLFAILFPATLALTAWELSRNRFVAFGAPIVYVFAHGVLPATGVLDSVPLFQLSPTRDFASFFVLLALLAMSRLLGRGRSEPGSGWWLAILAVAVFVATGSKGSAMPILLGGILATGVFLIFSRRVRITDFVALATFVGAAGLSTLLVLPDPTLAESLSWGPLTFLSNGSFGRVGMVVLVVCALALVAGLWITLGRDKSAGWVSASLIGGVGLASVLALSLLAHPGSSQLYFWQSAQPVFAIGLSWAIVLLARGRALRLGLAIVGIFFLSSVMWELLPTAYSPAKLVIGGGAIIGMAAAGSLVVLRGNPGPGTRVGRVIAVVSLAAVLTQAAQIVSVPTAIPGGSVSTESDVSAIDSTQLGAYEYIRTHSLTDDVLITNKHCVLGSIPAGDCIPIWFALAAWTERHVLVDGWGYTQRGPLPGFVQHELDLSDGFIAEPTADDVSELRALGVEWVYVDKRLDYSTNLSSYGDLVYESTWADVYRLDRSP